MPTTKDPTLFADHERRIGVLERDTAVHGEKIGELGNKVEKKVSMDRFEPVQRLVYGVFSILVGGVVLALGKLVLKQ